jgi:D-3-phosphoglycerate dehydrogenase
MLILNLEPDRFSKKAESIIRKVSDYEVLEKSDDNQSIQNKIRQADIIITRLGRKIDKQFITDAKKLKVIVSATTGLNHIDLVEANRRRIKVISLRGEISFLQDITSTAEFTISLILEYYRNTGRSFNHVLSGSKWNRDMFRGEQLSGKSIGIIGMGRLGNIVASYAKAFRMIVFYSDIKEGELGLDSYYQRLCLEDCLKKSDIVSLHANFSNSNVNFFNEDKFKLMKNDALFVNTSRGEMVDEAAMLSALQNKKIGGAALDVISDENDFINSSIDHPLIAYANKNKNLIITPHIGGASSDAMELTELFVIQKLISEPLFKKYK